MAYFILTYGGEHYGSVWHAASPGEAIDRAMQLRIQNGNGCHGEWGAREVTHAEAVARCRWVTTDGKGERK